MGRVGVWTLCVLAALAPGAAACSKAAPPLFTELGEWEPEVRYYLKADGGKTFLSESPDGGAASHQPSSMGSTSGSGTWANGLQGRGTDHVEFTLGKPLERTLWLNLSKPVVGTLYLTSTVQATASRGDPWVIRFEIFQGESRVGGFERVFDVAEVRNGFYGHNFCFRPEARTLEAGATLKVRITRVVSGGDLTFGTGSPQGSFVEFHYFDSDPLVGALYVEKGKLLKVATVPSSGGGDGAGGLVLGVPLLGLGLLGGRRRRVLLLAALVSLGALAGCVGDGKPAGDDPAQTTGPSATVKYEDLPPPATNGTGPVVETGSLLGRVQDPLGLPVKDAHVLVAGTSNFAKTPPSGTFRFDRVPPGEYTLRIDHPSFDSYEEPVEVLANKVANITITLTYPAAKQANDKPHVHDDWSGETERTLMNGPFTPAWTYKPAVDSRSTVAGSKEPVSVVLPASSSRSEACPGYGACEALLKFPANTYVLPGAREVEITLSWTGTNVVRELGIQIVTPANVSASAFVPRESGKPFHVHFFPNEADYGHQKYSDWGITLTTPLGSPRQPFGSPMNLMGSLNVKVRVFKGVVPFEQAHNDLWGNQTLLPVLNAVARSGSCLNCDYPVYHADSMWAVSSYAARVPADAKEVRGVLSWTGGGTGPAATPWGLVYRGSNWPLGAEFVSQYPKPDEAKASAGKYEFTIRLEEGEADQFYQKLSKWYFFIDDGDAPSKGVTVSPTTEWKLTVTAHR